MDISNNISGETLRKVFMTSLTKIDDIKQVSFNGAIKNLVRCTMALNHTPVSEVKVDWGNPLPEDKSEMIDNSVKRINSGTLSRLSAICELDNISVCDAKSELSKVENESVCNLE